jgi:hypothetical protein
MSPLWRVVSYGHELKRSLVKVLHALRPSLGLSGRPTGIGGLKSFTACLVLAVAGVAGGCRPRAVETSVELDSSLPVKERVALAQSLATDVRLRALRAELAEAFPAHADRFDGLYLRWRVIERQSIIGSRRSGTKVTVIVGITGLDREEAARVIAFCVAHLRASLSESTRAPSEVGV